MFGCLDTSLIRVDQARDWAIQVPELSCPMLRKVISGAQAGADRAGLDFAIEAGLEHGGFVRKGRKAEDGRIEDRRHLTELSSASCPACTKRNVRESGGTAIFGRCKMRNVG